MKQTSELCCAVATAIALLAMTPPAAAEDVVQVVVPNRGGWESAAPELGQQAGIFKKHGLVLEVRYTENGGAAEAAVEDGSADVGLGVDAIAALRAYSRGTPVRIIGANLTGDANYWYVLPDSPIKTIKDLDGRSVAYATNGSSSHYDLIDLLKRFRVKARLVATGRAAAALERLTGRSLDVGWARPPFGVEEVEQGKIRVVARANDVPGIRTKTETVLLTTAGTLKGRADAMARFLKAYRETIDWMYADADAPARYAALAGISPQAAQRVRAEFFPKGMLLPDQIVGLSAILRDAKEQRYIQFRMSRKELAELIKTPARTRDVMTGSIGVP